MELAVKLHACLVNGSSAHELLDMLCEISDKNMLARLNEFFLETYNETPHEFISEKYHVEEVYAIDSTLKYIRHPNDKNRDSRDKYCKKIGYSCRC
jgi:hypothetical protein